MGDILLLDSVEIIDLAKKKKNNSTFSVWFAD